MDDFLAGPEHIFSILESALPDVHAMRKEFPDAVVLPGATALPTPSDAAQEGPRCRQSAAAIALRLVRGVLHQLKTARPRAPRASRSSMSRHRTRGGSCCARSTVSPSPPPTAAVWCYRQRDRAKMFALLRASMRQQLRLARKFNRMRKVYREALPVLSSKQKWETVLLQSTVGA